MGQLKNHSTPGCWLIGLLLMACSPSQQSGSAPASTRNTDSLALTQLLRNLYTWYETSSSKGEFAEAPLLPGDSLCRDIDTVTFAARLRELEQCHLLHSDFVRNYREIGTLLRDALRSGKLVWYSGDIPPFGETDHWCNCQESPEEYWNQITLADWSVNGNEASGHWTWGEGRFAFGARKTTAGWRVSFLEGFTAKQFTED